MSAAPQLQFRTASPDDSVSIAALAIQVFLDTYATEGVRPDLAREAFHEYSESAFAVRLLDKMRTFTLAERGSAIVGFAEVLLVDAKSPVATVRGAELVRLYIQPRAQGAGIGRSLIARSESLAAAHGLAYLWLTAWDGNDKALAFYRRMGYADMGATTYTFQGKTYGNRVCAKKLA